MIFILRVFIFIFGLVVGSFLNCVIYRLALPNFSFWKNLGGLNRSFCPHCKHILSWQDLLPVFSFIMLKGKCRYCGEKISWQYPAVEIATGVIFLLILNFKFLILNQFLILNFKTFVEIIYLLVTSSLLIIIFVYDLKHFIIPDKILFSLIGIVFLYRMFEILYFSNFKMLTNPLFAAVTTSAFFLVIFLVSQGRWLGFGDVKLVFFMGLFLGYPEIIAALFFSFFIGAAIGTGLIFLKKKTMKSEVPFGPFLITGTFIGLFWGRELIDWYSQFLLK